MIVIVKKNSDEKQLNNLISWIKGLGLEIYLSEGANSTVLGLITMVLFKPRSWCVYCPMGTMTQLVCKARNSKV